MKMKKALALVLATSMVLGSFGFASAAPATAGQFDRIVEAGIFVGDNGDLMLDKTFNRAEFAAVALRLMGEGFTDAETEALNIAADFKDVEKGKWFSAYVGRAQKEGLVEGDTATKLYNPEETVNYVQALTIVMRALGYVDGTDLVNYPSGYYAKAKEIGLADSTVKADTKIQRKVIAEMLETALDLTVKGEDLTLAQKLGIEEVEAKEVALESVEAIGAKNLQVRFNKPVSEKAEIAIKRGTVTTNVAKITWNKERTEATIELSGKITTGEYTVTVKGASEKDLVATVKTENERVEAVSLLSDLAVFNSAKNQVTVGYKVTNQYGEDITNSYAVNPTAAGVTVNTSGTVTATRGVVTVPVMTGATGAKEGDAVVVTLVHVATGKAVSQTLKISAASTVSEVTITGVYNKDGKTLTETTNLTRDAFYLVVEGLDQYGNAIDATALDALLKNNTNPAIVGISSAFETIKISGKDATVLRLTGTPTVGMTNVMLISATSGKNASYTVQVAEAQRSDVLSFEVPELVVAGETLFIPVTVLDKDGNEITDLDVLNHATRGIKIGSASNVLTKNTKGVIGYNYTAKVGATVEGYISLVALTANNKSTVQNIKVEKPAIPTVVRGLASTESAVVLSNKGLTKSSLVVEDQYGRAMTTTTTPLTLAASSAATSGYRVIAKDVAGNTVLANNGTAMELYDGNTITLLKGTNGVEKVEFTIEEYKDGAWRTVLGSSQEIEFRVTDGTEYASYAVEEIGTIFDEVGATKTQDPAYSKELVVYGILDDGKKVELTSSEYTVSAPTYLGYTSAGTAVDGFDVNVTAVPATVVPYATDAKEVKANVTVTINATGQQFKQEVTVSKVAPTVKEFKIVAEGTTLPASKSAYDRLVELSTVTATGTNFFTATAANTLVDFIAIDSYGVISKVDAGAAGTLAEFKLVVSPAVAHSVTIANQNSNGATIAGLEKGEVVTITATIDGASKSFKLVGIVDSVTDVTTAMSEVNTAVSGMTATNTTDDVAVQGIVDATAKIAADSNLTGTVSDFVKTNATSGVAGKITFKVTFVKGSVTQTVAYEVAITALP